jgi:CheY-like chemotaxis protein
MPVPPLRAHHIVRFSTHDDDLVPAVADFVSDGVRLGERVVLVITRDRWQAVERLLIENRVRIATAIKHHEVVVVLADDVLAQISEGGHIDLARVDAVMQPVFATLAAPVRVYGELSSLIAAQGRLDIAMELERRAHAFVESGLNLLCGYRLSHLSAAAGDIDRICQVHHAALAAGGEPKLRPIVLLADDFQDGRELYEEYLRARGYQVVAAEDGLQALSLAHIARPAVILLDVRMPRMSGLEAMQILKKQPAFRQTPIVALTAYALDSEREMFLSSGFDAVLAKPCLPADVARTVEQLLN